MADDSARLQDALDRIKRIASDQEDDVRKLKRLCESLSRELGPQHSQVMKLIRNIGSYTDDIGRLARA